MTLSSKLQTDPFTPLKFFSAAQAKQQCENPSNVIADIMKDIKLLNTAVSAFVQAMKLSKINLTYIPTIVLLIIPIRLVLVVHEDT